MKSMYCLYHRGRFDDQYSFELEGFMTRQEFAAIMSSFNDSAKRYPAPPALSSGRIVTFIVCVGFSIIFSIALAIHYTHHIALMLIVPLSLLVLSMLVISWRRRLKTRFETAMLQQCACMNATENVRGINFRLLKQTPESCQSPSPQNSPASTYAIIIEFDDRYNLLHHFAVSEGSLGDHLPPYRPSTTTPPCYSKPPSPQVPSNVYHPDVKV